MSESDRALFDRWAFGRDAEAFQEIVSRHSGMVYGVCRRILANAADAEDVAQECFETLAQPGNKPGAYLGAWLHRVAANASLKHIRAAKRRRDREQRYVSQTDQDDEIEWQEIYGYVDEAIAGLPEKVRAPIVAHFLEGQTHKAIAQSIGLSRQAVAYRINKGIEYIRKSLQRRGIRVASSALAAAMGAHLAEAAPASLTNTLGKLALAGRLGVSASGTVAKAMAWCKTASVWGVVVMKTKIEVGILVLLLGAAAVWLGGGLYLRHAEGPPQRQAEQVGEEWQPKYVVRGGPEDRQSITEHPETELVSAGALEPGAQVEGGVFRGRVYDKVTGEGISGVVVWAQTEGHETPRVDSEPTDFDGFYEVAGLAEAQYRVQRTTPEGYQKPPYHDKRLVTMKTGMVIEGCDFALSEAAVVAGVVIDLKEQPVSGAELLLVGGEEAYGSWETISDEYGAFAFHGRTPDIRLAIIARKNPLVSRIRQFDLPDGGITGLVLKVGESATVSGKVVDTAGRPRSDIWVRPHAEWKRGRMATRHGTSDSAGRFELTGLSAGKYTLSLRRANVVSTTGPREKGEHVKLDWGEHLRDLVLVYDRTYVISGRVTYENGQPVEGAVVQARNSGLWGPYGSQSEKTGPDGRYEILDLPEATFDVGAIGTLLHSFSQKVTDVPAGSRGIDLVLPSQFVEISGRVVCGVTGEPVQAFKIGLLPAGADPYGRASQIWGTTSTQIVNEEGRFQLKTLEYGEKTLVIEAPGYLAAVEPIVAVKGGDIRNMVVRLQSGKDVTGFVKNAQGRPIADASVVIGPIREGAPAIPPATLTDSDGAFSLEAFPPGPQVVSAYHPDYAFGWTTVDARTQGARPVKIVLSLGGTLEGIAQWGNLAMGNAKVRIGYAEGHYRSAAVQPDGTYRITGLAPGEVDVQLSVRDQSRPAAHAVTRPALIEDGEATIVDFDIPPGNSAIEGAVLFPEGMTEHTDIFVSFSTEHGTEEHFTVTGDDGRFRIDRLPAGVAAIEVLDARTGDVLGSLELTIEQGTVVHQDIDLTE